MMMMRQPWRRARGLCPAPNIGNGAPLGMGLVRECGVAAVNSDARPYRLKLLLLAHTVILVGAMLLVATWF